MKKKLLAMMLAGVMVIASVAPTYASEVETDVNSDETFVAEEEDGESSETEGFVVESGKCGDNAEWAWYSNGELTISGSGAMDDYEYYPPWSESNYVDDGDFKILKVDISDGITSIGDHAFARCGHLKSIVIPDSVISIGTGAFSGCGCLTNITIPNGVTSIGKAAFGFCEKLTSIVIPNGVTSIEEDTFSECTSLASVEIPNGVTCIGEDAFYDCSSLTSIEIPNSVTSIEMGAFSGCASLTSLAIPKGVTCVENFIFENCSNLTSVMIPSGVTEIKWGAFSACGSLEKISVDTGNSVYDSRNNCNAIIETASNSLILGCAKTIIPDSVISIDRDAFSGCTGLTAITIPNSVTNIGKFAFYDCINMMSVTIPDSVTSIGEEAFGYYGYWEEECYEKSLIQGFSIHGANGSEAAKYANSNKITLTGHMLKDTKTIKAATCNSAGTLSGICTVCGGEVTQSIPATGKHTYSAWKTTKAATVFAVGTSTRTCSKCGKKETKSIAKLKATIKLSKTSLSLKAKKAYTIKVTYAKGDSVKSWKSSSTKIATVTSKGKITAKKKGKATITVTLKSGKKATVKVTVK